MSNLVKYLQIPSCPTKYLKPVPYFNLSTRLNVIIALSLSLFIYIKLSKYTLTQLFRNSPKSTALA